MTRGRPPNLSAWLHVLSRLRTSSVSELKAEGRFSPDAIRHYIRDLVRRGYVEPARYFSHLPSDGAGSKRYVLTRRGKAVLAELQSSAPQAGIDRQSIHATGGGKSEESSAGATTPSAHPRRPHPRYSQRYVGGHNLCFRMVIEQPFERPFVWATEHAMGPKDAPRWMSRHAEYEPGVHIEEAGGTIADPAGTEGHVVMLKFAVPANGRSPTEVEREAESRADGIRRTLELRYGCQLSEPTIRGHPKHSFPHDPFAKVVRARGITLHGPVGVDDTPDEDTLEIEAAAKADAYLNLPGTLERLAGAVESMNRKSDQLAAVLESIVRAQDRVLTAQGHMLRQLEELRRREPIGPTRPGEN